MSLSALAMEAGLKKSGDGAEQQVVGPIEFIESPHWLGLKLFPVQRIIIKAYYGIPLDDTDDYVVISDWRRKKFRRMTEAGYLRMLYEEGRCNIKEVKQGDDRRELILSIGRRSGKTMVSGCIAAYETYKLLMKGCPQKYYGLPDTDRIQIVSVATSLEQAGILFANVSGHYRANAFFKHHMANDTQTYAAFQTPYDVDKYGHWSKNEKANATVRVSFKSCVAKGIRGIGAIVAILDEVAHFQESGQSGAEEVYKAISPALAAYSPKDANDSRVPIGPVESRMILISTPNGRSGLFHEQFRIGFKGTDASKTMLCIQAPTWEVNPTIPAEIFEIDYIKDATAFFQEFGGVFTNSSRVWIENKLDLLEVVDPDLRPKTKAPARMPHFMGIDLGLVNDAAAVAIGHIDSERRIVLDYLEEMRAGEGEYEEYDRLDHEEVVDWIYDLTRRFRIVQGFLDPWCGIIFEQMMEKRGLNQIKKVSTSKQLNSDIYKNFKDLMWGGQLVLFDWPRPPGPGDKHSPYIEELLLLEAKQKTKNVIEVAKPATPGSSDDMSDALVRMVWLASQELGNSKYIAGSKSRFAGAGGGRATPDLARMAAKALRQSRLRNRGGSSPDRQASRINRGHVRGRRR